MIRGLPLNLALRGKMAGALCHGVVPRKFGRSLVNGNQLQDSRHFGAGRLFSQKIVHPASMPGSASLATDGEDWKAQPSMFTEENRALPEPRKQFKVEEIVALAKAAVAEQLAAGKNVKLPFRMWQLAMSRCTISYDDYKKLSPYAREIVALHWTSVKEHKLTYVDPRTKYHVMNVTSLLLNGSCCGRGCRHCPYGHANASEGTKQSMIWNGGFYQDVNEAD
uniref:Uncharacterized protein n=1 Tax=Trichuris muris TaxID=70415 RepID=A0A5S6QPZ3_TRIMR